MRGSKHVKHVQNILCESSEDYSSSRANIHMRGVRWRVLEKDKKGIRNRTISYFLSV